MEDFVVITVVWDNIKKWRVLLSSLSCKMTLRNGGFHCHQCRVRSGLMGLWKTWKTWKSQGINFRSGITWETWKSQGIFLKLHQNFSKEQIPPSSLRLFCWNKFSFDLFLLWYIFSISYLIPLIAFDAKIGQFFFEILVWKTWKSRGIFVSRSPVNPGDDIKKWRFSLSSLSCEMTLWNEGFLCHHCCVRWH